MDPTHYRSCSGTAGPGRADECLDLRPTAGHHAQMDPRERAVVLVRQLLEIYSSEELGDDEDVDAKINESLRELSRLLPDPAFNDLIRT
jgi:hypothetical protein